MSSHTTAPISEPSASGDNAIIDSQWLLLGQPIGEGGSRATVFHAEYTYAYQKKMSVAVKKWRLAGKDGKRVSPRSLTTTRASFITELAHLKAFRHPNIIDLYGWNPEPKDDEDSFYIVMEFAALGSLSTCLSTRREEFSWHKLGLRTCLHVCRALEYIHSKNRAHFDVKPSNVLIFSDNVAKLADFGLAKSVFESSTNQASCTTEYAAPEILEAKKGSKRSDIFSFGLLLRVVYNQDTSNPRAMQLAGDCPESLSDMVTRCLSPKPADRPMSKNLVLSLQYMAGVQLHSHSPVASRDADGLADAVTDGYEALLSSSEYDLPHTPVGCLGACCRSLWQRSSRPPYVETELENMRTLQLESFGARGRSLQLRRRCVLLVVCSLLLLVLAWCIWASVSRTAVPLVPPALGSTTTVTATTQTTTSTRTATTLTATTATATTTLRTLCLAGVIHNLGPKVPCDTCFKPEPDDLARLQNNISLLQQASRLPPSLTGLTGAPAPWVYGILGKPENDSLTSGYEEYVQDLSRLQLTGTYAIVWKLDGSSLQSLTRDLRSLLRALDPAHHATRTVRHAFHNITMSKLGELDMFLLNSGILDLGVEIGVGSTRTCVFGRPKADGLIPRWNKENPNQALLEGDYITDINGLGVISVPQSAIGSKRSFPSLCPDLLKDLFRTGRSTNFTVCRSASRFKFYHGEEGHGPTWCGGMTDWDLTPEVLEALGGQLSLCGPWLLLLTNMTHDVFDALFSMILPAFATPAGSGVIFNAPDMYAFKLEIWSATCVCTSKSTSMYTNCIQPSGWTRSCNHHWRDVQLGGIFCPGPTNPFGQPCGPHAGFR
ncbi:Csk [Symbiodinium natans]|uniref:Csk protein n=1 Tax=Symbiodinium natans TaxID=878477 RepID=A0A812QKW9_9DINO|nr:Csk [Symbiodinium natans]